MQSKLLKDLLDNFAKRLQVIYDSREAENLSKWMWMHLCEANNAASFSLMKHEEVSAVAVKKAEEWLTQLLEGKPLQHLIGEVTFADVQITVNSDVLIPRPETEELIYLMVQDLGKDFSGRILDVGTGSGCIAIALKNAMPKAQVTGLDISQNALKTASYNAERNALDVTFVKQDILEAFPADIYDVIVSNPPYIPINEKAKMDNNVVQHEPHLALFTPEKEPLIFYKRIVSLAQNQSESLKGLFFELHEDYARETLEYVLTEFEKAELVKDLQDKWRFLRISA